jgi:hypothetical protein
VALDHPNVLRYTRPVSRRPATCSSRRVPAGSRGPWHPRTSAGRGLCRQLGYDQSRIRSAASCRHIPTPSRHPRHVLPVPAWEAKNPHRKSRCGFGLEKSAPDRIRTCDLMLRRHALYPTELRALWAGSGISRVLSPLARRRAISLGRRSPAASSGLPGTSPASRPDRRGPRLRPCLALLRVGFTMPLPLPAARWSLTPPFHPYLCRRLPAGHRRFAFCGTFQRLAASGRYPAPCPVELGLSSAASWAPAARTRFPSVNQRLWGTSAPRRSRTPNLRIRSPTLYPIELWAL